MCAALLIAQMQINRFAPASGHTGSHHFLHGRSSLRAFSMGHIVHRDFYRLHHQIGVYRHTNMHVVDRFIRLPSVLPRDIEHHGFGIAHMAFNIPKAIFTLKALVVDASCVRERAGLCG